MSVVQEFVSLFRSSNTSPMRRRWHKKPAPTSISKITIQITARTNRNRSGHPASSAGSLAFPSAPRVAARNASYAITKQNRLVPATIKNIARLLPRSRSRSQVLQAGSIFVVASGTPKTATTQGLEKSEPTKADRTTRLSEVNTVNRFVDT